MVPPRFSRRCGTERLSRVRATTTGWLAPNGTHFDQPERASLRLGLKASDKPDAIAFRLVTSHLASNAIGRAPLDRFGHAREEPFLLCCTSPLLMQRDALGLFMPSLTQEEIKQLLPHRDPFLWIDEVVDVTESKIHARKLLPAELDVFRGHYPHFPVFPGVLQLEASFQAGAIMIARFQAVGEGQVPVVTRVNNTKFRHMVRPGDLLDIEVELTERLANAFFMTGKVSVAGQTTVRLEFACTAASV